MSAPTPIVFGTYLNRSQADNGITKLLGSGFEKDQISVVLPDNLGSKELAHDENNRAGSSTAVVTTSVAVGGSMGLLVGLGALAIPGLGPLLIAGPMLGALAGFGVGGAVGGVIDAFEGIGIPRKVAPDYVSHIKDGGLLMTVICKTENDVDRTREILLETGAEHITSSTDATEDVSTGS